MNLKVTINGIDYMPIPEYSGGLSSDELHQIACLAAIRSTERHDYMPVDMPDADRNWRAHAWVLEAMRLAIVTERACGHSSPSPG